MAEQREAREIIANAVADSIPKLTQPMSRTKLDHADAILAALAAEGWSVERLDPAGVGLYDLSDPDRPRRVMVPLYRVISPSIREAENP